MIKRLFALVIVALSLPLAAQTNVQCLTGEVDMSDGIVYSLPKTEINFLATAERTIEEPGMFYQYAKRYFGTNDIIIEPKNEWKLIDVKIYTTAIEDTSRTYQVMTAKKGISNNLQFYGYSNIIAGINCEELNNQRHPRRLDCTAILDAPSREIKFNYDYLSEEVLVATSIPKMAEMAAMQIYRIRENRAALLAADVDNMPNGDALKLMLEQLDVAEAELLALFVGKRVTYRQNEHFSIAPVEFFEDFVIFRISEIDGLVDADDIMGTPVYLTVDGEHIMAPELPAKAKKKNNYGFFYNIPGSAVITVSNKEDIKRTKTVAMPQFGYTANLPISYTDSETAIIEYNPELGTIKRVEK